MRLLITQRPNGGHVGEPRQAGIFGQDFLGLVGGDKKEIQGEGRSGRPWPEAPFVGREIKTAERKVEEQGPSIRTHKPGNGNSRTVRSQVRGTLTMLHGVGVPSAINLRTALTQSKDRSSVGKEPDAPIIQVDLKTLKLGLVVIPNDHRQWLGKNLELEGPTSELAFSGDRPDADRRLHPLRGNQNSVIRNGLRLVLGIEGKQ